MIIQPQYPNVLVDPTLLKYADSITIPSIALEIGYDFVTKKLSPYSKSGTVSREASSGGIGYKGNGTNGYYTRLISKDPSSPCWVAAQFVCNVVSTDSKTSYSVTSSGGSGSYLQVASGYSTATATNKIRIGLKAVDLGPGINKLGPTPVVGTIYTAVGVFPSNLKADAYMYVNGIKYTDDHSGSANISFTGANTYVNQTILATKINVLTNWSPDIVLFAAHGFGQLPEAFAEALSNKPWQFFKSSRDRAFISFAAAGGVTGTVAYTNVNDSVVATGTTTVTGSLSYTNVNDSVVASGTTTVTGTIAYTNINDSVVASGKTTVVGSLAYTNADDSVVASGSVGSTVTGTVAYTNVNDSVVATGTTTIVGSLAYTNINDTSIASGTTAVIGSLSYTNINDSVVASGSAGSITGTVAYTNVNDSVVASGTAGTGQGVGVGGGAGHPVGGIYYQNQKRVKIERRPLDKMLDKSIKEYFDETLASESVPKAIKAQIVQLVKPFNKNDKGALDKVIKGILDNTDNVAWDKINNDVEILKNLFEIYKDQTIANANDDIEAIELLFMAVDYDKSMIIKFLREHTKWQV